MTRKTLLAGLGTALLALAAPAAFSADAAPATVTADQAKPYIGTWVVTLDAPPGPMLFTINVKVDAGKVVASVNNEMMGEGNATSITTDGKTLTLAYTADMQGMPAPVTVVLTPKAADLQSDFSFMNGQFSMSGVATPKK